MSHTARCSERTSVKQGFKIFWVILQKLDWCLWLGLAFQIWLRKSITAVYKRSDFFNSCLVRGNGYCLQASKPLSAIKLSLSRQTLNKIYWIFLKMCQPPGDIALYQCSTGPCTVSREVHKSLNHFWLPCRMIPSLCQTWCGYCGYSHCNFCILIIKPVHIHTYKSFSCQYSFIFFWRLQIKTVHFLCHSTSSQPANFVIPQESWKDLLLFLTIHTKSVLGFDLPCCLLLSFSSSDRLLNGFAKIRLTIFALSAIVCTMLAG